MRKKNLYVLSTDLIFKNLLLVESVDAEAGPLHGYREPTVYSD